MRPKLELLTEWASYKKFLVFWILTTVSYILIEFAFNASLLNAASGFESDPEALERLEQIGRVLASIGCSFAVFSLFRLKSKNTPYFTFGVGLRRLLVCLAIVGPTFYVVSDYVIEKYIIQPSSYQDRYVAYVSDYFKRFSVAGTSPLDNLEDLRQEDLFSPEAMTLFSARPLANVFSPKVFSILNGDTGNTPTVQTDGFRRGLEEYMEVQAHYATDEAYKHYLENEEQLADLYDHYLDASEDMSMPDVRISDADFERLWTSIRDELRSTWPRVEEILRRSRETTLSLTRGTHSRNLYNYYVHGNYDPESDKVTDRLIDGLKIYGRRYYVAEDGTVGMTTFRSNPYVDYCGGRGRIGRTCNPTQRQLADWLWNDLGHKHRYPPLANGVDYPVSLSTYTEFLNSPVTGRHVRDAIAQKTSLHLPSSFDAQFRGSKAVTRTAIDRAAESKALSRWREEFAGALKVSESSLSDLRPGMSFSEFIQVEGIEAAIRRDTGGYYMANLALDMSEREFHWKFFEHSLREVKEAMSDHHLQDPRSFGEDPEYIDLGLKAYRAAMIPPIALMLSLFFSLIAVVKLPLMINELIYASSEGKKDYKTVARRIFIAGALAIVLIPIFANPVDDMRRETRIIVLGVSQTSPAVAVTQHWMLSVEPRVYGFGQAMIEAVGASNLKIAHISQY